MSERPPFVREGVLLHLYLQFGVLFRAKSKDDARGIPNVVLRVVGAPDIWYLRHKILDLKWLYGNMIGHPDIQTAAECRGKAILHAGIPGIRIHKTRGDTGSTKERMNVRRELR